MRVGDFELVEEPLHLGDANGNRFEVRSSILRNCAAHGPAGMEAQDAKYTGKRMLHTG